MAAQEAPGRRPEHSHGPATSPAKDLVLGSRPQGSEAGSKRPWGFTRALTTPERQLQVPRRTTTNFDATRSFGLAQGAFSCSPVTKQWCPLGQASPPLSASLWGPDGGQCCGRLRGTATEMSVGNRGAGMVHSNQRSSGGDWGHSCTATKGASKVHCITAWHSPSPWPP